MILSLPEHKNDLGESYLKLQLNSQIEIALSMKYAKEVLIISKQQIAPIPNMPNHVVGLLNQRNHVFWLTDLSLFLGFDDNAQGLKYYNVAVIQVKNVPLGLVVQKIKGVTRIQQNKILSSFDTISSELIPYIKGYFTNINKQIFILDPIAIIANGQTS